MELVEHGGKTLLFVMAVEAEYGPHLRQRFTPLMTGVGPVGRGVPVVLGRRPVRGVAVSVAALRGAGTVRHCPNAVWARVIIASSSQK